MGTVAWIVVKYLFIFSLGVCVVMAALQAVGWILGLGFVLISPFIIAAHLLLRIVYMVLRHFGFDKKGRGERLLRATSFYYKHQDDIAQEISCYEAMRLKNGLPPFSTWEWVKTNEDNRYAEVYQSLVRNGDLDPSATRPSINQTKQNLDSPSEQSDPYTILGVPRGASSDEIKAAYRALMKTNHPDRVIGLDSVFQNLANVRTREIQRAYECLLVKMT